MRWIWLLVAVVLLGIAGGLFYWFTQPPPGKLILRTVPAGVQVAIDGRTYGATPDTGLVVLFDRIGHRFIELSREGYETDTSTVWVATDQVIDLEIYMRPPGMALIRGGEFEMGWDDGAYNEKPAHQVRLNPFYMDRTEVTVAAFKKFQPDYRPAFEGDGMPATNISWQEAHDYCLSESKRLPSEAEWERACRGSLGLAYSYGQELDISAARTAEALQAGPVAVGSFASGSGGLYDMTGNVWEWCADWYERDAYQTGSVDNPQGPKQGTQRVLRGGAWYSNATAARCTHRPGNVKKTRDPSFGFRCVKDLE